MAILVLTPEVRCSIGLRCSCVGVPRMMSHTRSQLLIEEPTLWLFKAVLRYLLL